MTSTKLYPGMCDDSMEIFYNTEESELMVIKNGCVFNFDSLNPEETIFLEEIISDEPEAADILQRWHTDFEDQKKRLAKCRFGGLNFTPDLKDGKIEPDMMKCNHTATCEGLGIICKPLKYKDRQISQFDVKAIKLLSSSKKNSVIAEDLNLPLGSFEIFRTKLYKDLRISTKQEVAGIAFKIGLL